MPPKADKAPEPEKKISAKDKKRLKELEKREELEAKCKEAAEQTFKAHEKERLHQEKVDRQKRHLEQVRTEKEDERLQQEAAQFAKVWADFSLRMSLTLKEYEKHRTWDTIVETSTLPAVNDEADINSFLSVWRDGEYEGPGDEERRRDIEKDFAIMEEAVALIQNILVEVDHVRAQRAQKDLLAKRPRPLEFHRRNLLHLYAQVQATLDRLTANVMQYLDKYVDQSDEPLTLCKESTHLRFGLWAGNKVPRVKTVDFGPLGMALLPKDSSHLPKHLNLMNNVAVRVLHFRFDPQSINEKDDVGLEYYALGGVFIVETVSVPVGGKQVRDWLLRTETQLAYDVTRIAYPPLVVDPSGPPAPPIRITFQVPDNVVVRTPAPVIGIWSVRHHCWLPEGTTDFTYDRDRRRATFLTQSLTKLAIIQEKGFDVPYECWYLRPLDAESVLFGIEGRRRHDSSDGTVQILIRNNFCRVVYPEEPELQYLRTNWLPPATLLRLLSQSGYNFVLKDTDSDFTPDILPKTQAMESKGYNDLALFCTTFQFASTRHNKFGEDKNMCLFRISKQMRDATNDLPLNVDVEDSSQWHTVRYEKERCVLTLCRETDEVANIEEAPDCVTHLNLYMAMVAEFPGEDMESRVQGAELLQSAVFQLLALVRPFTWG